MEKCTSELESLIEEGPNEKEVIFQILWSNAFTLLKTSIEAKILIGLIIADKLLPFIHTSKNMVVDLTSSFPEFMKSIKQPTFIDFASAILHKILSLFSSFLLNQAENLTNHHFTELVENKGYRTEDSYIHYSMLQQILDVKSYIVIKEIKKHDFNDVYEIILNEKQQNQSIAQSFMILLIKRIGRLSKDEQKSIVHSWFIKRLDTLSTITNENYIIFNNTLFYFIFSHLSKSLFTNEEMMKVYEVLLEHMRGQAYKKNPLIWKSIFEITPEIIGYNSSLFSKSKYLDDFCDFFEKFQEGFHAKELDLLKHSFTCLRKFINCCERQNITKFCNSLFFQTMKFMSLNPKKSDEKALVEIVLDFMKSALQTTTHIVLKPEKQMNEFVDNLLIYHFNQQAVEIVELLHKSDDLDFNHVIETKLKLTISIILKNDKNAFDEDNLIIGYEQQGFGNQTRFRSDRYSNASVQRESVISENEMTQHFLNENIQKMILENQSQMKRTNEFSLNEKYLFRSKKREFIDVFEKRLEKFYVEEQKIRQNEENFQTQTSVALEVLARFDFGNKANEKRVSFIKDTVFAYLESPYEGLRKIAVRIVLHLSSEDNGSLSGRLSLAHKTIQSIVDKMMSMAVSDSSQMVREETLGTLNSKNGQHFLRFLVKEEILRQLLGLVFDHNKKVQEYSILILRKIIPLYPRLLVRFEQIIFRSISVLASQVNHIHKPETKAFLRILSILSKDSVFLFRNIVPVLANLWTTIIENMTVKFQSNLFDQNLTRTLKTVLKSLKFLLNFQSIESRRYFDCLTLIFVRNRNIFPESVLISLIQLLIIVVRNSGLQMVLIFRFDFLKILLELLDTNHSIKLRINILRLWGTIGAVDTQILNRINSLRSKGKIQSNISIPEVILLIRNMKSVKMEFGKCKNFPSINENQNHLVFDQFFKNLHSRDKTAWCIQMTDENQPDENHHPKDLQSLSKKETLKLKQKNESFKADIDTKCDFQSEEDIQTIIVQKTTSVLLESLDPKNSSNMIIQSLESIQKIIPLISKGFTPLLNSLFVELNEKLKQFGQSNHQLVLLKCIRMLLRSASKDLTKSKKSVRKIVSTVVENVSEESLQLELFDICDILINERMSQNQLFKSVLVAVVILIEKTPFMANLDYAFDVLHRIDNTEYLHLVTPILIGIVEQTQSKVNRMKSQLMRNIVDYFNTIKTTQHFFHNMGNIVKTCIVIMNHSEAEKGYVQQFLVEIIRLHKSKIIEYLPLIHQNMRGCEAYFEIVGLLKEKGFIEDHFASLVPFQSRKTVRVPNKDLHPNGQSVNSVLPDFRLIVSAFSEENFPKSEKNWEDWLIRLKTELILNSPSPFLSACKNLRFENRIMDALFKPAFIAVYSRLKDEEKQKILTGFDLIVSLESSIPMRINQELLSLVEWMSTDNKFSFVLDFLKLSKFSSHCFSQSKAIFFKEVEFNNNPETAVNSLILLYRDAGLSEAAEGLFELHKDSMFSGSRDHFCELLNKWDYLWEQKSHRKDLRMQIKCSAEHSDWESVVLQMDSLVHSKESVSGEMISLRNNALFHLSKWDDLEHHLLESDPSNDFLEAVVCLKRRDFEKCKRHLDNCLLGLEKEAHTLSHYGLSYEKTVALQKVSELEEMIDFVVRFEVTPSDELHKCVVSRTDLESHRHFHQEEMLRCWRDKLHAMEPRIKWVENVLSCRSVLFSRQFLIREYLFLSDVMLEADRQSIAVKLLDTLDRHLDAKDPHRALVDFYLIRTNHEANKTSLSRAMTQLGELVVGTEASRQDKRHLFKKTGQWAFKNDLLSNQAVHSFLSNCVNEVKTDHFLWHCFAMSNYKMVKESQSQCAQVNSDYVLNSIQGFALSLSLSPKDANQDHMSKLLRLLETWFDYHDLVKDLERSKMEDSIRLVPTDLWILVIRQVLAKTELKETFLTSSSFLLSLLSDLYPQQTVFPLLMAMKTDNKRKSKFIGAVLKGMETRHSDLIRDAVVFSEELIRVSVLHEELWLNGYNEVCKHKNEGRLRQAIVILLNLFDKTLNAVGSQSFNELVFFKRFGRLLQQSHDWFALFLKTENELFFVNAWNSLQLFARELEASSKNETDSLLLRDVSPELNGMKDTVLAVPGTLKSHHSGGRIVRVAMFNPTMNVLKSKRKPRKFGVFGSDGKEYSFLLKGNEDLRLDERMMQLFSLTSDLLKTNSRVYNRSLKITTFTVLPLSFECGIISWVESCDTIYELIRDHRLKIKMNVNFERNLYAEYFENYNVLSKVKKMEVFRFVCENTKADELQRVFWSKSQSAEKWLANRHNFICSLATMSMVGHLVGLGDRHLMNIMIEQNSGKVIHIDFGDCFESAMLRERLPERVPFRLTRILANAMEACKTEGTFKGVCESVMGILRTNREVISAVLEEFVCDPILTWRRLNDNPRVFSDSDDHDFSFSYPRRPLISTRLMTLNQSKMRPFGDDQEAPGKGEAFVKGFQLNEKALHALKRIKLKLAGKEFSNSIIDVKTQVGLLIAQATSQENISQAYVGWNPFL